jgi:hypothetical protein
MIDWAVPPLWAGQTVAICATGPGMTAAVAEQLKAAGIHVIAINDSFRLVSWAAMLYAADVMWWATNEADAMQFRGLKVTAMPNQRFSDVLCLRSTGDLGFDPDPACIRSGGNSGYQAIHVAIHAKASRILLCGYDMTAAGGDHWFGRHRPPLRNTDEATYTRWAQRFGSLKGQGAEILNCTPRSALQAFPHVSLEQALKG